MTRICGLTRADSFTRDLEVYTTDGYLASVRLVIRVEQEGSGGDYDIRATVEHAEALESQYEDDRCVVRKGNDILHRVESWEVNRIEHEAEMRVAQSERKTA